MRCFTPAYFDSDIEAEIALLRSRGLFPEGRHAPTESGSHNVGEELSTMLIVAEK